MCVSFVVKRCFIALSLVCCFYFSTAFPIQESNQEVASEYEKRALAISDPRLDLRLRPGKGCTVFYDEENELEITLTKAPYRVDAMTVCKGLEAYDREKIGPIEMSLVYADSFAEPVGWAVGSSLVVDQELLRKQFGLSQLQSFLSDFEVEVSKRSVKQLLVCSVVTPQTVLEEKEFYQLLEIQGFKLIGVVGDQTTKSAETCWGKVLTERVCDRKVKSFVRFVQNDEPEYLDNPVFFFVRDQKSNPIGGALAHVVECSQDSYIKLMTLWIDSSYRGHGLGKKLLQLLEDYASENNIKLIVLSTGDHQAPWLYEKMGYTKLLSIPLLQKHDGSWLYTHNYLKNL